MIFFKKNSVIYLVAIVFAMVAVGCESNFKEIQKDNFSDFIPSSDADEVNLKYTDSGRITGILISKKMLDYAVVDFPFTEFPKGIHVTLYDKNAKKTVVTSNYAVTYKQTGIIDLQGKVKIVSEDGQILETQQLYYDQNNAWFFTERKFKFTSPKGVSNGQGIDFSKDFKVINSQRLTGEVDSAD
ncbi:LPS export ABC transporter periplasmic protein LptC [Flavobacterium sp.]|jgi:LPS export ABC transporter protein LptC|uniref:LPS export ABC transporter periplasmic protein LptC n=1 Tax=Flavobacterium sp. TaxID=239 RepID=UPI0025F3A256|nr:LPS export ABC transporter periplasmic protein LptC [Flavobacterium sp.]